MKSLQTVVSGECGKCSMVSTKYGNVCTDHILFICSGAFHSCKPSDMLAELQGRLPIRVELKGLTQEVNLCLYEFSFSSHRIQLHWSIEDVQWAVFSWMSSKVCAKIWGMVLWQDLYRILTEPEMNMIKQQQLLMKTEGIELIFTDEAIKELAGVAAEV